MIEHIKEIEKYDEDPSQTPPVHVENLLRSINSKYRLVRLVGIGGEGILIQAYNQIGKQIILKIARSSYQGQYAQTPKQQNVLNVFSFKGKPKPTNISYGRFLEGAKLQQDIYQMLIDDNETSMTVPGVLDISLDPLYFTMPYLENLNILRFFKDFNKKLKDILATFVSLLRGIEYIHARGIIHRDLKSDNILVGNKLKGVVVLDWTFSKQVGNRGLTVVGTQAGTPGLAPIKYMSGDFKDANFLDDIYLLGFVLWEFVTGVRIANVWTPGDERGLNKTKVEDFKRKIITKLPECLHGLFWDATEVDERKRIKDIKTFRERILEINNKFDLAGNTLLSIEEVKQLENEVDVIFDTTCDVDYCKQCPDEFLCKKYELCNLLAKLLK